MAKRQRRITSIDVAQASGVSRATVSYVLNNDPRQTIPAETRERVIRAANQLGYRPSASARILRAGYSRLVLGVLQFEQVDPGLARALKDLESRLAAQGFSFIWYVGVHMAGAHIHLSANLTPAVIVSFVDETDPEIAAFLQQFGVPVLPVNHATARQAVGRAQVGYLVQRGQRQIVFAAPERSDVQQLAQARLEGVRQACAEYGLAPPLVQMVPGSRSGARVALAQLLEQQSPAFGVCCYNDEVALAVLAALSDADIPVPTAVAVIGCDDISLAQFSTPALTTLGFENQAQLDRLIDNILAASQGEPTRAALSPSMAVIVRESA